MSRFRRALFLSAGLLLVPGPAGATPPAVELVLLLDAAQIQTREDVRSAHRFCRDLLENLPPRVHVRAFQFGRGSDLVPCDAFRSECLEKAPTKSGAKGSMTLQQALSKGEAKLCGPGANPDLPGRVLVLLGRSPGSGALALSSSCKSIHVAAVALNEDRPLRELAERTHGAYGRLGSMRGFTLASKIKNKVWLPSVHRMLVKKERDESDHRLLWLGSSLAMLTVLFLAAFWRYARASPATSSPRSLPAPPAAPLYEASLRICSDRGAQGAFQLSWEEPMILGGKRDGSLSPAHIVIDDPLIAEEHCQIQEEDGVFFVVDLGSGSGTFVNGEPLDGRRALVAGDLLRIGGTMFELVRR